MNKRKRIKLLSFNTTEKETSLYKSILQMPLCFPRKLALEGYNIMRNNSVVPHKGFSPNKGFILKKGDGWFICSIPSKFQTVFLGIEIIIDTLPNSFDFNVMHGLISIWQNRERINDKNYYELKFKTVYSLLKSLGLPTSTTYYKKIIESLVKWQKTTLQYNNIFYKPNVSNKKGTGTRKDSSLILEPISSFYVDLENDHVSIVLDKNFMELCNSSFTTPISHDVILKIKVESTKNLYLYLETFDRSKTINRKLIELFKQVNPGSNVTQLKRVKESIKRSIESINKANPNNKYETRFYIKNKIEYVEFTKLS